MIQSRPGFVTLARGRNLCRKWLRLEARDAGRPAPRAHGVTVPSVGEGTVLAAGRDAEIVDLGSGRVLRRPKGSADLEHEARVMHLVRQAGYPAPAVFMVRAEGMVMERVSGPTMLDDLGARPWRFHRHAISLARLHNQLHQIPAIDGLKARFGVAAPDDVLIHGDLHPANVMMSPEGPMVIDWANAGRGPAGADVADAWLILAAAQPPGGAFFRGLVAVVRGRFLAAFLSEAGRSEAARYLALAAMLRSNDPNLTQRELAAIHRTAALHGVS
jgi:aminoglycoside phosphotransferase (APT) family kinase protein